MERELQLRNELTDEERKLIYSQNEELRRSIEALLAENELFEGFIARLDLQELDIPAGDSRVSGDLLTLDQKLYVINKEFTETQQDKEKLKEEFEKIKDNYKASMKEADLRLTEISRAKNKFECRFFNAKEKKLEMKEPEKVLKYIEDKSKIIQLEKLKQRNQALRLQEKKLLQQLQLKRSIRKADYEVFSLDISEPTINKSPDELKVHYLKLQRALNLHKEKLQTLTLESTKLTEDIEKRNQQLSKTEEEMQTTEKEHLKAQGLNKVLRRVLSDYRAPDITQYMRAKDHQKKLQQSVHAWERKAGITQLALNKEQTWKQRAAVPLSSRAEAGARRDDRRGKLPSVTPKHDSV